MTIFNWEFSVLKFFDSLPHTGIVNTVMRLGTDFSITRWIILGVVVCLLFLKGWKKIGLPIFLALLGVGLADLVARRIIKALIMRPRPHYVGLDCSMSSCWGFVSSHSTNVTAACTILCLYDRRNLFWSIPVIFIVGISRLYFLDHFPLDVIGGTVLGFAIGFVIIRIFADPLSKVRG